MNQCPELMQPASGFVLPAFFNGQQKDLSLADFRGKWLIIFFYGSDFSFV